MAGHKTVGWRIRVLSKCVSTGIKTNGRTFTLTVARVYDDPPRVAHPFQSRIL